MDQATVKPSVVCLVKGFNVLREKMRYYKLDYGVVNQLRRRKLNYDFANQILRHNKFTVSLNELRRLKLFLYYCACLFASLCMPQLHIFCVMFCNHYWYKVNRKKYIKQRSLLKNFSGKVNYTKKISCCLTLSWRKPLLYINQFGLVSIW